MELQQATISEIAASSLAAVRVFEKLGIDYCCGGKRPLEDACEQKGYDPAVVRRELESAIQGAPAAERDWSNVGLKELVDHILRSHHEYLRRELGPLGARLDKVYRIYNEKYGPTLQGLPEVFAALRSELEMHLRKEETILFPAIAARESAALTGTTPPATCFGSIANPIRMMEAEHDGAGEALAQIRAITADYAIPDYACVTYRSLMAGLQELEQNLHMHIHLENNILFPRGLALESSAR